MACSFFLHLDKAGTVHAFQGSGAFADSTSRDSTRGGRSPFSTFPFDSLALKNRFPGDTLGLFGDSLHRRRDSTYAADTTHWVAYLDSTVRMEQFLYRRTDRPAVDMFQPYTSSLFLDARPTVYKRELQIDSLGQNVTVRERVNGLDVKVPQTLTLGEYVKQRFEHEKKSNWRSFVSEYQLKDKGDELANLFGSLTRFVIPVPSNPLLSIFGGSNIDLRITGAVDIHGAYRRTASDQVTTNVLDQVRDEPDFNQDVLVNVNGTIGDKLNILADWNTQRTFEYENQLKIKYTGYEDEIIQSVEAGNVSLQTPSFIGGGQALFGIKAKIQTGPFTLTTLLSQKKGQTKELVVSSGAQQNETTIKPDMYSTAYYFLDTLYRKFFETLYSSTNPLLTDIIAENQVVDIDVWVSRSGVQPNPNERQVNAYIDLPGRRDSDPPYDPILDSLSSPVDGKNMIGRFVKLDGSQYKVNRYAGFITLNTNISDDQAVAVAYRVAGPSPDRTDDDVFYGQLGVTDTGRGKPLILKLVKPKNLQPSYKPAWDLQLKNIYPIGGRDLKKENFGLRIFHVSPGKADEEVLLGQPLLQVLGLDRFNADNLDKPDNSFDFIPALTVDVERAEIIFPSLRPFDSTIVEYFRARNQVVSDSLLFSDVYDTTKSAVQNNTAKNNYYMKVKASTAQRNSYQLGFNIVEGSVQVLLNGQPLQPNVDYTVDYISGDVVIRNLQALAPGANVQIKYEQNDLFQLAAKTLIGARGEFNLGSGTVLGMTAMNLNQATLSDKVRLGEEPTNNLILGIDGSTSMNLPFLTKLIDALPFIRTREMSSLRFGGEAAYMLPDPNTKRSTISGDLDASIAYIDDFEGARRTIPFSITYSGWHLSSPPVYSLLDPDLEDSVKTYHKAKLSWYNRLPSDVTTHEIWPNRSVRVGQDQVTVLNLDYIPTRRGPYNYSLNLPQTLRAEPEKNWAGVMRYISSTAGNIIDQNINYIEIWMKASSEDINDLRKGKLYFDLGRVSEQVIPMLSPKAQSLHSEDLVVNNIANGVLNPGEDVGLDMLSDEQERNSPRIRAFLDSPFNSGDPDAEPNDPSGDDWSYSAGSADYTRINGTENNEASVDGRFPDTEDLNGNGEVDLGNTYLEYEIPLDSVYYDSLSSLKRNHLIVGGGTNKWYQFRIPLLQANRIIPEGSGQNAESILQNVQFIRMWVSGFQKPVSIRIAEIDLVGNQWQEFVKNDSTMKVSVVNIEDNPTYRSPPGVIREIDRTQPDQIIEGNEQSLDLIIRDLRRGESRQAVKYFTRPIDVFNYKSMKMFVHGDPSFDYISSDYYDAEVFLRFGTDTLNFYEYRQPIRPGWDPLNNISISFSELTSIKAARDSLTGLFRVAVKSGPAGATYGVQGNPSLTQIRYMGVGVTHASRQSRKSLPISGEVWVNELRVVNVDNSAGLAYRFDSQAKLADFGNVGFSYSKLDPNFHGLDQRFGSRVTGINWSLNTSFSLEKFFPQSWQGTSIPVGYSHSENITKPKYLPNTDVLVDEAANRAVERGATTGNRTSKEDVISQSQSLHIQDSYTVSNFHIGLPTDFWLIRDTFGKLSFGFNYSKSSDRNPSILGSTSWVWNLRVNHAVNLPADYYVQPFQKIFSGIIFLDDFKDWKFYYMPFISLTTSLSGQRSRTYEVSRGAGSIPRETRNFGVSKSLAFGWKLTEGGLLNLMGDYSLSTDRALLQLDNDSVGRGFGAILKSLFFGGRDNRYSQRVTINSKPTIPNIFDIRRYLDLTGGYSVNYGWQNTFQNGDLGKSASFANNIVANATFRLKALTDPWFKSADEPDQKASPNLGMQRVNIEGDARKSDSSRTSTDTSGGKKKSMNLLQQLKKLAYIFIKIPFLDYDNISINFNQTNQAGSGGVLGSTGFKNFWGRWPFQGSLIENGPSRLFQLGLISDPSGTLRYSPSSQFPFVGWTVVRGLRAPNGRLSDQYSQTNALALRTTRPLWEGANLEVNWKVGWQFTKMTTINTDQLGRPTPGPPTTTGSVERSFFSMPPVLFFKVFKSSLEGVGKKYDELKSSEPNDRALAESFEKGLETMPFLSKVFGSYFPRPNWTFRWDGIEKIVGLSSVVERMSIEHSYSSSFKKDFRGNPDGGERTDAERVANGFSPLLGVTTTFKELWKGSFAGNARFNTTTSYDLNLSAGNITETLAQEISLSLTYSRRGFSFPLFGVNLNNDIDMSMAYSRTRNSRRQHNPAELSTNQEGVSLEGTTRTSLEPRIRYVLSSRVTAALFYRYTKVAPDEGGSLVPGTTTNEAGLDIHIAIQ